MGQADWVVVPLDANASDEPLYFDDHAWRTIEAATARIIPTDRQPGAREARAVRFIDRMLAGTQFVYASADGSGFLRMDGLEEKAWLERVETRRALYDDGVVRLDELARSRFGQPFVSLREEEQDAVLEELGGPKPARYRLDGAEAGGTGGAPAGNQPMDEDLLDFFSLLVLNTRQGFYADPVYGGNAGGIGWRVIGFDGPETLRATTDGTYTTIDYLIVDAQWPYENDPRVTRAGWR
ncbi:hypothetical protein GCM10025864_06450 [Luteimicrobium album]|uniref:Gluconate 2-dehydrogenase subunit 3 family protein n=1 Tax=Luteimicrobium album TaxID=1054550 RepID=A0ABQ6HWN2_9MICO|nr:gluconate 2-dehydrogenase subunit 3 family protein [Luteimicrobium album]GMA22886.1 hypothetical protein GCM10025864_06450 [Luteimicrobium album]